MYLLFLGTRKLLRREIFSTWLCIFRVLDGGFDEIIFQ